MCLASEYMTHVAETEAKIHADIEAWARDTGRNTGNNKYSGANCTTKTQTYKLK